VAKFAEAGKETPKKDLGLLAMSYGNVYVAKVAFGAKMSQTVQAFLEAEAYPGPSIIIAYSHCIAHGYDLVLGTEQQKRATESGMWPLYRFDPRRVREGQPPLHLDSGEPKLDVLEFMRNETRFRQVERTDPERFKMLLASSQRQAAQRYAVYKQLAGLTVPNGKAQDVAAGAAAVAAAGVAKPKEA
jgi:pyruvate-ferredoxin/flavodoxin oxidoreductase